MLDKLQAWARLLDPAFWWLALMVAVWTVFALMVFVLEPLVVHRLFHDYALRDKERAFALAIQLHAVALAASASRSPPACSARTAPCREGGRRHQLPLRSRALRVAPSIAHRRAFARRACSRILEPEHRHFYGLGLPIWRSLCGLPIHKRSKINPGQSAAYPRYVPDALV